MNKQQYAEACKSHYDEFIRLVRKSSTGESYLDLILPHISPKLDDEIKLICLDMLDDNVNLHELGLNVFKLGMDAVKYRANHPDKCEFWFYDRVAGVVIFNLDFARHTVIAAQLYNLYKGTEPFERGLMDDGLSFMQEGFGFWQSQAGAMEVLLFGSAKVLG